MALLSREQIDERLSGLHDWRAEEGTIERELKFSDFAQALAFVNRVGQVAEAANHHPDILLHGWNKVRLTLSSHSEGGLTASDFDLAGEIDRLA